MSTSRTLEILPLPLTTCTTSGTILTGICWINIEDRDTEQFDFVFHEGLQLEERPTVQGILKRTVLLSCRTDTAQIFKEKCCVLYCAFIAVMHICSRLTVISVLIPQTHVTVKKKDLPRLLGTTTQKKRPLGETLRRRGSGFQYRAISAP